MAIARLAIPVTLVFPWVEDVETGLLQNQMIEAFVDTGVLDVVERARFDKISDEQDLTRKDITDASQAAALGKVLGARYFVIGTLSGLRFEKSAKPVAYTAKSELREEGRVKIDFRVVDVETSRVVTATSSDTVETQQALSGGEERKDWERLWNRLAERAAADVAHRVVDTLVPIKLITVEGDRVELSRGQSTGIEKGDVLEVYEMGAALVDPDTKRVVERRKQKVARIEVTSASAGSAVAKVTSRSGVLEVGARCRLVPSKPVAVETRPDPLENRW